MTVIQAIILGVVQGLTEFLPISSSGHLVLVPALLNWDSPGLAFDTILHVGTLVAVLAYFREDWVRLVRAGLRTLGVRRIATSDERLAWFVLIGCIPAGVAGIAFGSFFESLFHEPRVAGYFLLLTAALLVSAELVGRRERELSKIRLPDVLLIGIAQAIAILPGVSRSGATISGALATGLTREAGARFSFLLGTPAIAGAGLIQVPKALRDVQAAGDVLPLILGFAASAIVGYFAIGLFLRYLRTRSLYPFAVYCAAVGIAIAFVLGPSWG